ncbi:MAG: cytochrome c [Nitrospirota bacterium]|jgi:mono/diheme cytochrome c family protein
MTHRKAKGIFIRVAAVSAVVLLALAVDSMAERPGGSHEQTGLVSGGEVLLASSGESEAVAEGKRVFEKWSCSACHTINGVGGHVGPDLTHIGSKKSEAWLKKQIRDPRAHFAQSVMPAFPDMTKKELDSLVQYLLSLK